MKPATKAKLYRLFKEAYAETPPEGSQLRVLRAFEYMSASGMEVAPRESTRGSQRLQANLRRWMGIRWYVGFAGLALSLRDGGQRWAPETPVNAAPAAVVDARFVSDRPEPSPVASVTAPIADALEERPRASPPSKPPAPRGPLRSSTPVATGVERAHDSLRDEVQLIDRAASAIAGGRCREARQTLESYRSRFPSGKLSEEAAVLAIDVLGTRGEYESAREQARAFVASHPDSAVGGRLTPWLSGPKGVEGSGRSRRTVCTDSR